MSEKLLSELAHHQVRHKLFGTTGDLNLGHAHRVKPQRRALMSMHGVLDRSHNVRFCHQFAIISFYFTVTQTHSF